MHNILRGRAPAPLAAVALIALGGCWAPRLQAPPVVAWGSMREVLRDGRSEPRVALAGLERGGAIGVGALAALAGEITILDGRVLIARADGTACRVTEAGPEAAATLLARAEVAAWREFPLPTCATYAELDAAIAAGLGREGFDRRQPTPVRIRGNAPHIEFHVIAGACPIAQPDGPAPWRFVGALPEVELVGLYVEGGAGRWTHHHRHSHLHVVAPGHMGHLDDLRLTDGVLLLPAGR
ncbi:MAG: acetolactate decarboxylase [Planctomycetota bacterium]